MNVLTFDQDGVLTAFFSSVLFLAGYSFVADGWWYRPMGRTIASLDFGLVITLLPTALHYLVGLNLRQEFYAWYYGCSLYVVAAITLWRLAMIARVQGQATPRRRGRAPEPGDEEPSTTD